MPISSSGIEKPCQVLVLFCFLLNVKLHAGASLLDEFLHTAKPCFILSKTHMRGKKEKSFLLKEKTIKKIFSVQKLDSHVSWEIKLLLV